MMALLPTGSVSLYALTADRCFLYSSESRRTVRQAVTAFPGAVARAKARILKVSGKVSQRRPASEKRGSN